MSDKHDEMRLLGSDQHKALVSVHGDAIVAAQEYVADAFGNSYRAGLSWESEWFLT